MSGTKLSIRLFTKAPDLSLADGAKVLSATRTLLAKVEKSITGKDEPEIEWRIVAFRYECDGCGRSRPTLYDDWRHTDEGKDYCPKCQAEAKVAS